MNTNKTSADTRRSRRKEKPFKEKEEIAKRVNISIVCKSMCLQPNGCVSIK